MSDVLSKLGYDDKAQEKIVNSYAVSRFALSTLESKVMNTVAYLKNSG